MRFLASLTTLSVAVLTLAGCPAGTPMCPPDGTGFNEGTGLYCAYGVVVGGFRNCPAEMPNRFDFADGSFVCSSRPIGSRGDIPEPVCRMLAACAGERVPPDVGPSDVGMLGDVTLLCGSSTCRADQLCRGMTSGIPGGADPILTAATWNFATSSRVEPA